MVYFRKIRVGKRIENTEIQELLDEKLKNQKIINSSPSKEVLSAAQCEVQKIEENISKLCAERNCEIESNYTKNLGTLNVNFSQLGM